MVAVLPGTALEDTETRPLLLTFMSLESLDHVTLLLLAFAGLAVKTSCAARPLLTAMVG